MWFSILRSIGLLGDVRSRSRVVATRSRPRARPSVEVLESRWVPATFLVKNLDDAGVDSLRWAVQQANASTDASNIIQFQGSLSGTISLKTALDPLKKNINVSGGWVPGGLQLVRIQLDKASGNFFSIFTVNANTSCTISGLDISNADAGVGSDGGAIYNSGTLTVDHCLLDNNKADSGGAIYNEGNLTVQYSQVSNNAATSGNGGGILNKGILIITGSSLINGNTARVDGGGIENARNAQLSIGPDGTSIQISYNSSGFGGGGIDNHGTLTMSGGQLSYNSAVNLGGGLYNMEGSSNLVGVNITSNRADQKGGGVYVWSGSTTLDYCTITGNHSPLGAGAGWRSGSQLTVNGGTVTDTIEEC